MTGYLQSKIKDQEEQSKLFGHLIAENIQTLMLKNSNHVEKQFQS